MKRSMLQVYVKRSDLAVALYQRAFDAPLVSAIRIRTARITTQSWMSMDRSWPCPRRPRTAFTGNTMQFCLHFGEGNEALVQKACDDLLEGAHILRPLSPCEYSPLMADFIDRFGVRWCIFI